MSVCVIFGGAGFVGTHLAQHFLDKKIFAKVHLADIRQSSLGGQEGISTSLTDVREPISKGLVDESPAWIFNFAAIHREPGHRPEEFFETNLKGATNICAYAEQVGCKNIYFTSSIAIYGPCYEPTNESKLPNPITPYGGSKYPAELIHQVWLKGGLDRRLIISRPGVIYGPGDPGNILRMIRAIKRGYFAFPGSKKIHKSYAYIYGFIESIMFTMGRREKLLVYNYVEVPTQTIEEIALITKRKFGSHAPIISVPASLLMPVAKLMQYIKKNNNPIHPIRVKKAGTPTHIVPQVLIDLKFEFKYDFEKSLDHWLANSGQDFD
jgi:GlcNAc-P-P-Und epimerase